MLLVNTSPFPRRWPAFCEILGHPEWAQTGRWDSLEKLLEDSAELSARVAEVIATRDLAEWASAFDEKDIIWAPVASVLDVVDDPQVRDMGWIAKTESSFGPIETLNVPFKVHGASMGIRGPAPELGQDTLEILADLGIEGDELDRLATDGAIG